jgi:YegS/Rv2252/BmrU family lipid kinase
MTMLAIVNGAAGGGACGRRAPEALQTLRNTWPDLRDAWTDGPGHASALARQAWREGTRRFLVVGGDGTAFEVLNGLFPLDGDEVPTLGFLPLGTGNSFVRDFGVTDPTTALAALVSGRSRLVDVVRVDAVARQIHYLNLLSVGFSAEVGDMTNRRFKGLGAGGYIVAVLVTLARLKYPVFPIQRDDGPWDRRPSALLSFSNSIYTGGTMKMAPAADPTDGQVDVIRVGPLGRARFLATFPKIFPGTHTGEPGIEASRATRIQFDLAAPVECMIDGEVLALHLQSLQVLPSTLRVML